MIRWIKLWISGGFAVHRKGASSQVRGSVKFAFGLTLYPVIRAALWTWKIC
jgi:hypothetical protein